MIRRPGELAGLGGRIARISGWRRALLAVGLGVAAAAALPPIHALPLLIVAFTGLAWMAAGSRSVWRAFLVGWWFGIGHFLAAFYWIGAALLTDPERYAIVVVPVVLGMAAGLALFIGAAVTLVHLSRARGAGLALALAIAWSLAEWLRGHILSGFPMTPLGTAWAPLDAMLQVSALGGVWSLGLITVLAAAMPSCLATGGKPVRRWGPVVGAAAMLVAAGLYGAVRLAGASEANVPEVRLRLVQPSIAQELKWQAGQGEAIVEHYLAASANAAAEGVSHIVWPESALPYRVAEEPALLEAIARIVPRDGLLFTGSVRSAIRDGGVRRYWNSLFAIDAQGAPIAVYDKAHLVPFGEYIPFRSLVSAVKLTHGAVDFSAGSGPVTLLLPGLPALSVLICYEAIFPGAVVADDARPEWFLNITNDAWFGMTSGPYQHFASARLRAVEEGVPLVRAANNGISAVLDAHGRITARLGLNEQGVLDAPLPVALETPPLYARFGDGLYFILLLVGALVVLTLNYRSQILTKK